MKRTVVILMIAGLLVATAAGVAIAYNVGNNNNDAALPPEDTSLDDVYIEGGLDPDLSDVHIVLPGEGQNNNDATIAEYFSITGTIESVEEINSTVHMTITDENGGPAVLVISQDTVFPFDQDYMIGDTVTAWYVTNAPMIAIWPPQYNAAVLAVNAPEGSNIKVDRFTTWADHEGNYMISQDAMFAFTTDENTKITLANGDDFTNGDIEGRRIIVIYDTSTRSIPEMATANELIVLYEDIMPLV